MLERSLSFQTLYAELLERCSTETFQKDFPPGGSFYTQEIKGRKYWYYQRREPGFPASRKKYVGPDNEETKKRIAAHERISSDYRERRKIVLALKRAGFEGPNPIAGRILEQLSEAGVFRLRGVLVGTIAFQTYGPMLGFRLPSSLFETSDLDLAQFSSISIAVGDRIDAPLRELLRRVEKDFEPVPSLRGGDDSPSYILGKGGEAFRVDILSPNRGPDEPGLMQLPALQGAGERLRFLDYLIYQEKKAVCLYGPGILVNVPAPERYAVHKLIVSRRRNQTSDGRSKAAKDLQQAADLIVVLAKDDPYALRDAWEEMWDRGPKWRELSYQGASLLREDAQKALGKVLGTSFHKEEAHGYPESSGPEPG